MKLSIPRINFCPWIEVLELKSRIGQIPGQTVGAYIVAIKKAGLTSKRGANPRDKDICYIGMTTQSLRFRIRNFIYRIQGGNAAHSGAERLLKKYGKYPSGKKWGNKSLYIAYFVPFGPMKYSIEKGIKKTKRDFYNMGKVAFLEYYFLGNWYGKFKRTPFANAERYGE